MCAQNQLKSLFSTQNDLKTPSSTHRYNSVDSMIQMKHITNMQPPCVDMTSGCDVAILCQCRYF
jgi:hypothetical protein